MIQEETLPNTVIRPLRYAALAIIIMFALIALWAVYAPLATTIKASGSLISSRPSYEIQHPYGGQIKQIFIQAHDTVEKGQKILLLNVDRQLKNIQHITTQIKDLTLENNIIKTKLNLEETRTVGQKSNITLFEKYQALERNLGYKLQAISQKSISESERVDINHSSIEILHERRKHLQDRVESFEQLIKKGAVATIQAEAYIDQILELDGEINDKNAIIKASQNEILQVKTEAKKLKTEYRLSLLNQMAQNTARLPELQRQALILQDEIDQSTIISPINGSIVSLNFDTEQMYVTRGTTLLVLSQPLQHPRVKVTIPANAIDQVRIGMVGKMVIHSLPQRNLPNINVSLISISPEALRNEMGETIGYTAYADIEAMDLEKLRIGLNGQLNLATDMPVNLSLVGNTTTLYEYLIAPFFNAFNGAIQD